MKILTGMAMTAICGAATAASENSAPWLAADWWVAWGTLLLVVVTAILARYTYLLWRDAKDSSSRQAADTKRSLEISTAVAEAATLQAKLARDRTAMQMRAYVSVQSGMYFYQDKQTGNYFGASQIPVLNTGMTPAHDLSFRATAAVLEVPLPLDFDYPLPLSNGSQAVLGPHQTFLIGDLIPQGEISDADVQAILRNEGKAFFVWGEVKYRDVFEEEHYTRFCHQVLWRWPVRSDVPGANVPMPIAMYPRGYNTST